MEPNNLNQNNAPAGNPAPVVPPVAQPVGGGAPSAPVAPMGPAPTPTPTPTPVNPVVKPAERPATQPVAPSPVDIPTPVNPVYQPTGTNAGLGGVGTLSATEAIMQPTPPPAPDPVEEELKAPFRPAAPVPGSIGSAVSMPAGAGSVSTGDMKNTPSVAFNDPATMDAGNTGMPQAPAKKKMDKKTLIMIAILGGMVVIALVAVLVFMMM